MITPRQAEAVRRHQPPEEIRGLHWVPQAQLREVMTEDHYRRVEDAWDAWEHGAGLPLLVRGRPRGDGRVRERQALVLAEDGISDGLRDAGVGGGVEVAGGGAEWGDAAFGDEAAQGTLEVVEAAGPVGQVEEGGQAGGGGAGLEQIGQRVLGGGLGQVVGDRLDRPDQRRVWGTVIVDGRAEGTRAEAEAVAQPLGPHAGAIGGMAGPPKRREGGDGGRRFEVEGVGEVLQDRQDRDAGGRCVGRGGDDRDQVEVGGDVSAAPGALVAAGKGPGQRHRHAGHTFEFVGQLVEEQGQVAGFHGVPRVSATAVKSAYGPWWVSASVKASSAAVRRGRSPRRSRA